MATIVLLMAYHTYKYISIAYRVTLDTDKPANSTCKAKEGEENSLTKFIENVKTKWYVLLVFSLIIYTFFHLF